LTNQTRQRLIARAWQVYLNHGVTGPHGADVWVALRPEKIYLHVPGEGKAVRAAAQDAP
jgi:hypothetical protein